MLRKEECIHEERMKSKAATRLCLHSFHSSSTAEEIVTMKNNNDKEHEVIHVVQTTGGEEPQKDFSNINDDDYEMEQEEMFVDAHDSFDVKGREWGGPRRGGRLPEPTRYGDWERKGRCTDF